MRVDDVEGAGRQVERAEVPGEKCDIPGPLGGGVGGRLFDHGRRDVDTDDVPGRSDPVGEVDGEGAGTAADVEEPLPVAQVGQEVGGRVGRRPPAVGAEDGVGVAVDVGLARRGHGSRLSQAGREGFGLAPGTRAKVVA